MELVLQGMYVVALGSSAALGFGASIAALVGYGPPLLEQEGPTLELPLSPPRPGVGTRWRGVAGTFMVMDLADMDRTVVYVDGAGKVWTLSTVEFMDGRFEPVSRDLLRVSELVGG